MKFRLIIDKTQEEEVVVTLHSRTALADEIEALVTGYTRPDCIPAYREDDVKLLSFEDIECITVLNGKTFAIDRQNQHYRLRQRLYELENILPATFIRINKSTLANLNRLDRFSTTYISAVDAIFKCGYKEYVSRRCFAEIKRRFDSK